MKTECMRMEYNNGYWAGADDFEFSFVVLGPCAVLKNSKIAVRRGKHISLVSNKRAQSWHNMASKELAAQWQFKNEIPADVPVEVSIVTYAHDKRKRDLDNSLQAPLDALQPPKKGPNGRIKKPGAGILADDNQVKSLDGSRMRYDKDNPRVEITVRAYRG